LVSDVLLTVSLERALGAPVIPLIGTIISIYRSSSFSFAFLASDIYVHIIGDLELDFIEYEKIGF